MSNSYSCTAAANPAAMSYVVSCASPAFRFWKGVCGGGGEGGGAPGYRVRGAILTAEYDYGGGGGGGGGHGSPPPTLPPPPPPCVSSAGSESQHKTSAPRLLPVYKTVQSNYLQIWWQTMIHMNVVSSANCSNHMVDWICYHNAACWLWMMVNSGQSQFKFNNLKATFKSVHDPVERLVCA